MAGGSGGDHGAPGVGEWVGESSIPYLEVLKLVSLRRCHSETCINCILTPRPSGVGAEVVGGEGKGKRMNQHLEVLPGCQAMVSFYFI